MANTRSRLLKLLSNAEQALAESESLLAKLPKASRAAVDARTHVVEVRDSIARIEKLLDEPKKD
jgi:hypothetical protein